MKTKFQACQILAIDINATLAQIKDAYRNLARQWHPDRFIDPRLDLINLMFALRSNPPPNQKVLTPI